MGTLNSMTGFARVTGDAEWGNWAWEARSVNGRGLDIRVNVPPGCEHLDRAARTAVTQHFKRGNIQLSLRIELVALEGMTALDTAALKSLLGAFETYNGSPAQGEALAVLMTAKGVLDTSAVSTRNLAKDAKALSLLEASLNTLLKELARARADEGAALATILETCLSDIKTAHQAAEGDAIDQPQLIKEKLENRLADLLGETGLERERLALEAAIVAARADVREELDRLGTHIETGYAHLAAGSPVGRKLDFLAQELNREVNTLCSKSASLALTQTGLTLKGLVDQFKEQAANVE